MKKNKWISIEKQQPPDDFVEVKNKKGQVAIAHPTYAHFVITKRKGSQKPTVLHCQPYWNNQWVIEVDEDLNPMIKGEIVKWRPL